MIRLNLLAWAIWLAFGCVPPSSAATAFLGQAVFDGDAADMSGLTNKLENGTPENRLGSMGSAIAYTGIGNRYLMLPDRGPADGAVSYRTRVQVVDIAVSAEQGGWRIKADLVSTIMLTTESGANLVGKADAISSGLRFDPEGIRVSSSGTWLICDEYGPFIHEFSDKGRRLRVLSVPERFAVDHLSNDPSKEMPPANTKGRQSNRSLEGLALSPDGRYLFGIMQSPLIQDGGLDQNNKRIGLNARILRIDLRTGATSEFLYHLADESLGLSEISAISDHEFLVIERDGKAGAKARFKRIAHIDISGATDISSILLPSRDIPPDVTPANRSTTPFIDLLADSWGLAGASFPEKIEGLAFGPDLPDGRKLLLVTSDNDFVASSPSIIWAFAVDPGDLSTPPAPRH